MILASVLKRWVLLISVQLSLLLPALSWAQAELLGDRWQRVDTENFSIISQVSSRETLRFANSLETWRQVAAHTIAGQSTFPKANIPNYVYLFDDLASYQMFTYATEVAFFSPTPRANFMAVIAGDDPSNTIALHHYIHFLVRNFSDLRLPRWYEEGLSGYISRMHISGQKAEFERFSANDHSVMVQLSESLSMDRLLYRDSALASPRVIQIANLKSETLLHYLLHGYEEAGYPDRRAQLKRYLDLIVQGRNERFAFDQGFDVTTNQLDAEFHNYLLTSKRPRGTIDVGQLRAETDYTSSSIDRGSLAIALAEMALNSGRFDNAQLFFQAAIDSGAEIARSYSGLGDALRMQEVEGMDQTITRHFEQAVTLAPDDPYINLDYGEFWESELNNCDKTWPQAQRSRIIADMQQHFARAVELAPNSPEANLAMGQVYLFKELNWEDGRAYQRKAFELLPADTFIIEQSAKYAIEAGDFVEAERLISELAQPIHFWGEPDWVTALRTRLMHKRNNTVYDACANE